MPHNARHRPPPRNPHPKPRRAETRKRVTLIAAIRCFEGAVLCADTMETVGDFRSPVHKIQPLDCGSYWLAVAGAGHGELVDGFVELLRLSVEGWKAKQSDNVIWGYLRDAARDYHEHEVALYPEDSDRDKRTQFLVCIKPKDVMGLSLWQIHGPIVTPVGDYALLGYGSALYKYELKKLYEANNAIRKGKTTNRFNQVRALLLGIHLFTLAKDTNTYIGGDTEAIYVFEDDEMRMVASEDVRILEERVSKFDAAIAEIVLKCPDTTTPDVELATYLDNFTKTIMKMRQYFAQHAAERAAPLIFRDFDSGLNPYLHMPNNFALSMNVDTGVVTIGPKDKDNPSFIQRKKPGRKKRV